MITLLRSDCVKIWCSGFTLRQRNSFLLKTIIEGKIQGSRPIGRPRRLLLDRSMHKNKGEDFEWLKQKADDREEWRHWGSLTCLEWQSNWRWTIYWTAVTLPQTLKLFMFYFACLQYVDQWVSVLRYRQVECLHVIVKWHLFDAVMCIVVECSELLPRHSAAQVVHPVLEQTLWTSLGMWQLHWGCIHFAPLCQAAPCMYINISYKPAMTF